MRKWMRERLKRRKKSEEAQPAEQTQVPLQPAYFEPHEATAAEPVQEAEPGAAAAPEPEPGAGTPESSETRSETASEASAPRRRRRGRGGRGRGGKGKRATESPATVQPAPVM